MNTRQRCWAFGLMLVAILGPFQHGSNGSVATTLLPAYSSRLWQATDYPHDNSSHAIAQTTDGLLWVGTVGGLARVWDDHFEFVPVVIEDRLGCERVTALCSIADGGLWVGTMDGLAQFKEARTTWFAMPKGADKMILSLHASADGSLWIGTAKGLVRYQNKEFSLINLVTAPQSREHDPAVRAMREDNKGLLWLGIGEQLIALKDGVVVTNYNLADFHPQSIRAISIDHEGRMWIGSNTGLLRFQDGHFTRYSKANGLPDDTITAVHEDRRNVLWIGTAGGLCRFTGEKLVAEMASDHDPYDQVYAFFEDREDTLWIGARDGLHQLRPQTFATYSTRHGLSNNNVMSVCEDDEGAMWIGTWGGGLHCLRNGEITIYSAAKNPVMKNDLVLAICNSAHGGIWFGEDNGGGLYRLKSGELQRWGPQQGLARKTIRALCEDRAGRLFIGSSARVLITLEAGEITTNRNFNPPESSAVQCLLQTHDEKIWIGLEMGLACWSQDHLTTYTESNGFSRSSVLALFEDKEGVLWIGTPVGSPGTELEFAL